MDKIKRFLIPVVQFLVGGLFIFSGLVKMNDPVGFSFKLEEYFSEGVLNLPFLEPLALPLAILLVITEVWLGADLLMGITRRWTMVLLTGMIVFFTFLTFWSAYFNQVTDCGCFGDAIPLTPWQSFYKDVILCVLIGILWWGKSRQIDVLPKKLLWYVAPSILIACIGFTYYVVNHLPVIDFRPYAVGKSIIEGMKSAEELDLEPPQYEVIYTMEQADGTRREITSKQYIDEKWGEKTEWSIDTSWSIKVSDGYEPPIHDFSLVSNYGDITDSILSLDEVWLLVAYNAKKTHNEGWGLALPKLIQLSRSNTPHFVLSASVPEEFQTYSECLAPFVFTDETQLKTMVRSNPGWVVLKNGVVSAKYHYNDTPN